MNISKKIGLLSTVMACAALLSQSTFASLTTLGSLSQAERAFDMSAVPESSNLLGNWKLVATIAEDPVNTMVLLNVFMGDPLLRRACKNWEKSPCSEYRAEGLLTFDNKVRGMRIQSSHNKYSETGLEAIFVGYIPAYPLYSGDAIPSGDIGPVELRYIQGIEASHSGLYASHRTCRSIDSTTLICKATDTQTGTIGFEGFVKSDQL